jgi:hypothetical protein
MLHAIVSLAYQNWPEDFDEFQPVGRDHLYGWLLVRAGYIEDPIDIKSRSKAFALSIVGEMIPLLKRRLHYIDISETAQGLRVIVPKSLDYKTAGKKKFEETRSKMYEILEAVLGVPVETLKREAKAA